jgi:hypothetical protein
MIFSHKLNEKKGISRKDGMKLIKEKFADNRPIAAMLMSKIDKTKADL